MMQIKLPTRNTPKGGDREPTKDRTSKRISKSSLRPLSRTTKLHSLRVLCSKPVTTKRDNVEKKPRLKLQEMELQKSSVIRRSLSTRWKTKPTGLTETARQSLNSSTSRSSLSSESSKCLLKMLKCPSTFAIQLKSRRISNLKAKCLSKVRELSQSKDKQELARSSLSSRLSRSSER